MFASLNKLARAHTVTGAASKVKGSTRAGRGRELSEESRSGGRSPVFTQYAASLASSLPLIGRLLDGNFAVAFIWRRTICKYKI